MINSSESTEAAPSAAMGKRVKTETKPERFEEIPGQGDRLLRLRKAYGFETTTAWAHFLDLPITTVSGFENGGPLSRQAAFRIAQRIPGMTLDWLYFANAGGLPLEVARRLGLLPPDAGGGTNRKT